MVSPATSRPRSEASRSEVSLRSVGPSIGVVIRHSYCLSLELETRPRRPSQLRLHHVIIKLGRGNQRVPYPVGPVRGVLETRGQGGRGFHPCVFPMYKRSMRYALRKIRRWRRFQSANGWWMPTSPTSAWLSKGQSTPPRAGVDREGNSQQCASVSCRSTRPLRSSATRAPVTPHHQFALTTCSFSSSRLLRRAAPPELHSRQSSEDGESESVELRMHNSAERRSRVLARRPGGRRTGSSH